MAPGESRGPGVVVKADQEQAALYAESMMAKGHALSQALIAACSWRSGAFDWSVPPVVGEPGDWFMGGGGGVVPGPLAKGAIEAVAPSVAGDGVTIVFEDPMIVRERGIFRVAPPPGLRGLLRTADPGYEAFFVIDPAGLAEALDRTYGMLGGAWRLLGVVTAVPSAEFPPDGSDFPNDLLRRVAERTTHVFFRGPSYDGLVVWAAPGAEPKGFFGLG